MYRCLDCRCEFESPENYREKTGVRTDGGFQEIIKINVCPICHGTAYYPVVICSTCGTEYEAGKGCPKCRAMVRGKFRTFLSGLSKSETNELDDLLDGTSVWEV